MPHATAEPAILASMTKMQHNSETESDDRSQVSHELSLLNFEAVLTTARPRLLHFARAQGVPLDAADDVVQETLLEAWRHLDRLHTPRGIDAWLAKICAHVCLRWSRAQGIALARQTSLSSFSQYIDEIPHSLELDIADPLARDPLEELSRQELSSLLDRALGSLPKSTREAIELCYLADLPQREAALRLGITINALDVRLHRAQRQLRQVLNGALRADAEAFGIALEQDEAMGWRETREWCNLCGRHHLHGCFEARSDGSTQLRLRCPDCSPRYGDMFSSSLAPLESFRTIRPAFKHAWKSSFAYWTQAIATGRQHCANCRKLLVPLQIVRSDEYTYPIPFPNTYRMIIDCPLCGITSTCSVVAFLSHPAITRFAEQHPRWFIGPEAEVEYASRPAIRTCLLDPTSAARLTVVADKQTLQVLATFQN